MAGPLLLFSASLSLNHARCGLHYLNKIQNLGERPGEGSESDGRLRNIASQKRPKKRGLFGVGKRIREAARQGPNIRRDPAEEATKHLHLHRFLGDRDSPSPGLSEWTGRRADCTLLGACFNLGSESITEGWARDTQGKRRAIHLCPKAPPVRGASSCVLCLDQDPPFCYCIQGRSDTWLR